VIAGTKRLNPMWIKPPLHLDREWSESRTRRANITAIFDITGSGNAVRPIESELDCHAGVRLWAAVFEDAASPRGWTASRRVR
jgi:hypothetical protein